MSTAFRLFLLTVLVFVGIWISRYRVDEIRYWLTAPDRVAGASVTIRSTALPELNGPVGLMVATPAPRVEGAEVPGLQDFIEPETPDRLTGASGGLAYADEGPLDRRVWADPGDAGWSGHEAGGDATSGDLDPDPVYDPVYDPEEEAGGAVLEDLRIPGVVIEPGDGERNEGESIGAGGAVEPSRLYVVQDGDSLGKIARRELGAESRWVEIQRLNGDLLRGGTLIRPGMELVLPAGGEE